MKRPQLVGNKVVTRYTDVNSIVLKNYIEISAGRLSKVRAGAQLTAVLRSETAQGPRPRNMKELGSDKDLSPRHLENSMKSNRDGQSKQVPISDFMENYLSQKNINEELLAAKENNIYSYFKEKFGLMGRYLGEDVLQDGLLMKSPNSRGEDRMKRSKNFDHEKEQGLQNDERESPDHDGRTPKIVKINRDIMSQILKEEHQKEMDALINLQTQQNMQVFNDLQDIGMRDIDKKLSSTVRDRTPPEKMIVKNNFLRTFVNLGVNENQNREDFLEDLDFRPRTTFARPRPLTDHLIFRTKQKKENLLPNVDKISNRLDMHKFGTKMILAEGNNDVSAAGYIIVNNQGISPVKARKETESSTNNSARPKFDIPTIDEEGSRNGRLGKSAKDIRLLRKVPSTSQAIRRVIKEEIEFLNEQRCPTRGGPQIISYRTETNNDIEMTPSIKEIPDEDPSTNNEVNRPPLKNTTAKVTNTKNFGKKMIPFKVQTKGSSLKGDVKIGTQVDGLVAKQISYYSPKVTGSSIGVSGQQPQMIKSQSVSKRDIKSFYSPPPRFKASQVKSLSVNNGTQPRGFVTRLVAVGKDDSGNKMNQHFISGEQFGSHKENNGNAAREMNFNEKSSGSAKAALSQNSFGNRYWKNNFFY